YIHFPWCARKCPYCDFNSHEARAGIPEAEYVAALERDMEAAVPLVWGRRVYSIFFGGGTPSLLSPRAVSDILGAARARFALDPDAEVTLEANPGSAEAGKFEEFRAAGVNRVSVGVQSFESRRLAAIGRIHDAAQARAAAEIALRHFESVNLDLMYALPGQDLADALADIETAIGFAPQHISAYHLTLEPNTPFYRTPPPLPAEEEGARMQEAIEERLAAAGYRHYETSAFARPGLECRHNLNYWRFGDYVGIGPGAHGKLSFPERILRQARWRHPKEWLAKAAAGEPVAEEHEVRADELPFEFMMNALRLTEGFEARLFPERTGLPLSTVARELEEAERRGLIVRDPLRIAPTELGRRFLNDLLQLFLEG
ncbi:MAG TPA: radical SAM family heme chaperone HemW, partial [Burkholderiales bacterium]|nr:radical SAM family heme chaperone HemW [Burkholderiales bacterium]